jgi:hypothetical protein
MQYYRVILEPGRGGESELTLYVKDVSEKEYFARSRRQRDFEPTVVTFGNDFILTEEQQLMQ